MPDAILTRQQVRELDRRATADYGIPSLVLMENAGRGTTDVLCRQGIAGPVAICCGKGNNAGDGLVIARHLDLRGYTARVLLWADPAELTGDAATNFEMVRRMGIPLEVFRAEHDRPRLARQLEDVSWIVDALLGTGVRGAPRPPLDAVIDQLNAAAAPRLAVDLPSGMDCDAGPTSPHVIRAQHTCTFVATKPGFHVAGAAEYLGTVHVLDIGAPRQLIDLVRTA